MRIRDKLSIYKKTAADITASPPSLEMIGAVPLSTEDGTVWRFSRTYPLPRSLSGSGEESLLDPFLKFNRINFSPDPERLLFFDLETTSLSTGSGNYPFLIGLGFIRKNNFLVEQYFLHDYSAEAVILKHLVPFFRRAEALVCFNGKSFDMPLIKNRYRLNRVPLFPVDIPVIDLLYPSRRVFRRVYESCSLATLEEKVLGIFRSDDIPGWLIPEVYFAYQRQGELDRIPLVVEHNAQDISSMYHLLLLLNGLFASLEGRKYSDFQKQSLLGLVGHLYSVDLMIFMDVMDFLGEEVWNVQSLFRRYSTALKRSGKTGEALAFWERHGSVYALEELAKHYEHREKDHERALGYASQIMETLSSGSAVLPSHRDEALRHRTVKRIERLRRRLKQPHDHDPG